MQLQLLYLLVLLASNLSAKKTFTAVVVEYEPIKGSDKVDGLEVNTAKYISILESLRKPIDIVVFPEDTLTQGLGYPSVNISTILPENPQEVVCNSTNLNYANFFKELSCAAIKYNTYLIVNLIGRVPNSSDSFNFYNTNAIFNRQGQLIAHYFKYNLFVETGISRPNLTFVTFDTDFGKFGTFTCFDLMFGKPALYLTNELNIQNIVFPTMWFSELPFLTALQAQQMWSHETDTLFLSSGANSPARGSGGSAIYYGKLGPIQKEFAAKGGQHALIQEIPVDKAERDFSFVNEDIDKLAEEMDSMYLQQENLTDFTSDLLDLSQDGVIQQSVCHQGNEFCCNFTLNVTRLPGKFELKEYNYRLMAFQGVRDYNGAAKGGIEVCAVVSCTNNDVTSCGTRFKSYKTINWPVTFNSIIIEGKFDDTPNRVQFPSSLLASIRPISPQLVKWTKTKIQDSGKFKFLRSFSTETPQNRLLTFGIFGRNFDLDSFW